MSRKTIWFRLSAVTKSMPFAIGGRDDNDQVLDTMESIQVSSLLEMETSTTRRNNSQWTRLQCRLFSPREECAAVVVHNRYVVILGSYTGSSLASSVDMLDTAPHDNGGPTIAAGPSMNSARFSLGAALMDNRHLCGGWMGQWSAIDLGGISLVLAAAAGQGPYK